MTDSYKITIEPFAVIIKTQKSQEEDMLEKEEVVRIARKNLEEGERQHKKVNVREIVFGFNDGSISTLALLGGVTGGALARSQILIAGFSGVVAGAIFYGYWRLYLLKI